MAEIHHADKGNTEETGVQSAAERDAQGGEQYREPGDCQSQYKSQPSLNAEEQVIRLLGPVEEGDILGHVVARPAICSDSGDALERLENVRIERCFRFQAICKPSISKLLHINLQGNNRRTLL